MLLLYTLLSMASGKLPEVQFSLETYHIQFFGQVFQSGKLIELPLGVLASEFSVEAKNISCFAGEFHELFAKISKGGPH